MPPTQDQEEAEHEQRMDQMAINIEKMHSDLRYEGRKFTVQLIAALGTAFADGVAALGFALHLMGKL